IENRKIQNTNPSQILANIPFLPFIFKFNIPDRNLPQIKKDIASKNHDNIIRVVSQKKLYKLNGRFILLKKQPL
ncbi:MAG: hypothetical protein J6Z11_02115, partial [Candidatus Riflebacteria bacterium]|nr:hypothetical protein [Candidatus Riflebacteria bacterium]